MTDPFQALADPTRRKMLEALLVRERQVGELVAMLQISQPSVSKHLRVLRSAGLVQVRPERQRRWYSVRSGSLAQVSDWLEPFHDPIR